MYTYILLFFVGCGRLLGYVHISPMHDPNESMNLIFDAGRDQNNYFWQTACYSLLPFWGISPRNSTSFTRLFLARRRAWGGHETTLGPTLRVERKSNLYPFATLPGNILKQCCWGFSISWAIPILNLLFFLGLKGGGHVQFWFYTTTNVSKRLVYCQYTNSILCMHHKELIVHEFFIKDATHRALEQSCKPTPVRNVILKSHIKRGAKSGCLENVLRLH